MRLVEKEYFGMNRRPKEWVTLAGRFLWLLEHYNHIGVSGRALAERAGLSPTTVATWSKRFKDDPLADLRLSSVVAIRKVFDCPWEWLAENKGWPSEAIRIQFEGERPGVRSLAAHRSRQ